MNDAKLYSVIPAPRVSATTVRGQEHNQYAFDVATDATKADIKVAIEKLFDVQVKSVNVVNVKGKNKAFRNRNGRRGDSRKAYVTRTRSMSRRCRLPLRCSPVCTLAATVRFTRLRQKAMFYTIPTARKLACHTPATRPGLSVVSGSCPAR